MNEIRTKRKIYAVDLSMMIVHRYVIIKKKNKRHVL